MSKDIHTPSDDRWQAIDAALHVIEARTSLLEILARDCETDTDPKTLKKKELCTFMVIREIERVASLVNRELELVEADVLRGRERRQCSLN